MRVSKAPQVKNRQTEWDFDKDGLSGAKRAGWCSNRQASSAGGEADNGRRGRGNDYACRANTGRVMCSATIQRRPPHPLGLPMLSIRPTGAKKGVKIK